MEQCCSCCVCQVSFDSPDLKGKGKEKLYTGRSCSKEREILEKFADTLKLSRSLLPTKGKLCYSCIHNLKNWEKKVAEVTNIQEQLKSSLQQSTHRPHRNKRTLSEAETEESAELHEQDLAENMVAQENLAVESSRMETEQFGPEESTTNNADESFNVEVDVTIKYKSGPRTIEMTPSRREPAKKLAKESYPSLASSMLDAHTEESLRAVGKRIQEEIAFICSDKTSSILKADKTEILKFSWRKVFADLKCHTPCLVKLLQLINPKVENNPALISVWIAMMVKRRNDKLSLIQRVFSVFLYGNGVHKEVYKLLQQFMLCMYHKSTLNVIDDLVEDYDTAPQKWKDKLTQLLPDDFEANPDDLDYDNNSGLGSAIMSVLGWVSEESDEYAGMDTDGNIDTDDGVDTIDNTDTIDETSSDEEEDGNSSDDGSDTESEFDFNVPPTSPFGENFNEDVISADNDSPTNVTTSPTIEGHLSNNQVNRSDMGSDSLFCPSTEGSSSNASMPNASTGTTVGNHVESNESGQVEQTSLTLPNWHGFKFVGDNIDRNVRPSFSRSDKTTLSLHCFHYYAVLDRVNLSLLSDVTPNTEVNVDKVLINRNDVAQLQSDAITLISRILIRHFPRFSCQAKDVQAHITCKHGKEMSSKSNVVPLGVIDKNENRVDEMCHIMDKLHNLVPGKATLSHFTLPDGDTETFLGETFHQLLLGGDQLTAARCRGSAAARCDTDTKTTRLYGLVPVSEDWHAKFRLCKVIYQKLFGSSLIHQKGSLPQLKVLINFKSKVDPEKCMKGCEDYLLMALHAHVIPVAKEILSTTTYDSVENLAKEIVVRFVVFEPDVNMRATDSVYLYALQVLNLGLLWHGFDDSIREGDGDRILTYYKFILNVFKAGRCFNYCKEVVILLTQYHCLFSERQAVQLKWSRCINTKGFRGCNVPCDLHLEHLNRRLKGMIRGLHSNVTPKALCRAARSVGIVHEVCNNASSVTGIYHESGRHTRPAFNKECAEMVKQLEEQRVFTNLGRKPAAYRCIKSVLQQYSKEEIKAWIIEKYGTYKM